MSLLCGFLVVRLPELNFDEQGRGAYRTKAPRLGNALYGGVDRMGWFDIDEDYYTGTLPHHLRTMREQIKKACKDFTGIETTASLEAGRTLLEYSNRSCNRNELIGISSAKMDAIKGTVAYRGEINWLGYDIVALGHWSLLQDGLFWSPSYFAHWHRFLNAYGLFSEGSITDEYARDYLAAAGKGAVEDLPDTIYGFDAVRVGRVL